MNLIDKDALVAEIKERIETYNKGYANGDDRRANALDILLHDLNSLEVKEVDLEKEITEYINKHFHIRYDETLEKGSDPLNTYDFEDIAKHFFELGLNTQKGK